MRSLASKYPLRIDPVYLRTSWFNQSGGEVHYGDYVASWLTNHWYASSKTPGYKQLKPRSLPVHPFQAGNRWFERKEGVGRHPTGTSIRGAMDYFYPNVYYAVMSNGNMDTSIAKAEAEQRALLNAKGMKMNVAQAWAERKQTANLLITHVNRFATALVAARKGNFKRAADILEPYAPEFFNSKDVKRRLARVKKSQGILTDSKDYLPNWWLEYHYGVIPLLNDIYGAAEMLSQQFNEPRPLRAVGSWKGVVEVPERKHSSDVSCKTSLNLRAKCQLKFDISNEVLQTLSKTGITNPLLLAWELVPLSFVADWFIPVGSYLSKLDATLGLSFLSGSTTVVSDQVDTAWFSGPTYDGFIITGGDYLRRTFIVDRYKLVSFPSATFPSIRNSFNVNKALTSLALITQLLKKS